MYRIIRTSVSLSAISFSGKNQKKDTTAIKAKFETSFSKDLTVSLYKITTLINTKKS